MTGIIIAHLWHSLVGWVGITGIVLAVSIYMFLNSPLPSVRHVCVLTATVCVCILFLYPKAYLDGVRYEKAQWTAAEQKAREAGDHARADALADVARGVRDPFDSDGN